MATLSGLRVRHTVVFSLRLVSGSGEADSVLASLRSLEAIEGVEDLEVVRQVSAKNTYEFGAVMESSSQDAYDAYDAYNDHPDHVAFVENRWNAEVIDLMDIDFVALSEGMPPADA